MRAAAYATLTMLAACGGAQNPRGTAPPVPTEAPAGTAPAATASPAPAGNAPDCDSAAGEGGTLREAGKLDDASALLERALSRCGNGHGLHNAIGVVRAAQHRVDEAAGEFIAELRDPHTVPQTFANLHEIYGSLSAARKEEIAGLGATDEAPIKVPTIRFEYLWVAAFGCASGGQSKVTQQALIQGKLGPLDRLDFTCPDGKTHGAYFDYSDDPQEKAMRDELKQLEQKDKQDKDQKPPKPKP